TDDRPIEEGCQCPTCQRFSRAYLRHLLKSGEMLSQRLLVMHNLWFYNHLMQEIRDALDNGTFEAYRAEYSEKMSKRI
ncbi:MAG: tRNA-guanine transglycosylase, partial [Agathobaculum butyriciproducens]